MAGAFVALVLATAGGAGVLARAQDNSPPTPIDPSVAEDVGGLHQLIGEIADWVFEFVEAVFFSAVILSQEDPASPAPDLIVDVTGRNWSWDLVYQSSDGVMLHEAVGADAETPRNRMVVPVNGVVRLNITSADVIHDLWIPAFGLKASGIPGRIESSWFQVDEVGEYYGECAELCGLGHAEMILTVEVVDLAEFEARIGSLR